jgi:hypothetical protein
LLSRRRQAIKVDIALSSDLSQKCDSCCVRVITSGRWNRYVTIGWESGKVQIRRIALEIFGRMKANYEDHSRDCAGI